MNEAGPSAIESADEKKPKSGGGRQRGKLKSEDKSNDAAGQKKPKSKRGRSRSDTKSEDKSNYDAADEKPERRRGRPKVWQRQVTDLFASDREGGKHSSCGC